MQISRGDYDIRKAFAKIENELLESMIRNMKLHRAEEKKDTSGRSGRLCSCMD